MTMRVGLAVFGLAIFSMVSGCKAFTTDCGDGVCEGTENCSSCHADCSHLCSGGCGDGVCATGETCATCPSDCGGACTRCGDGSCNALQGETCSTCPGDCGSCGTCGDGTCQVSESCMNCPGDCRTCGGCGDGICQGTDTCGNCPRDCGTCASAGAYNACSYDSDCAITRDSCISVTRGGVSRAFCGVRNCTHDTDCDNDMYGSPGLCVSFDGGSDFDCFHRCNTTNDCRELPGFTCGPTDGSATTMVCLPGSSASVPPYGLCNTSADCAAGLACEQFTVGSATTHMCSLTGCGSDNDCPLDSRGGRGACLAFGSGPSACWERCTVRGDCPNTTQFDCSTTVGSGSSVEAVCVVHN